MAITASGLYFLTFEAMLTNAAAINLEAEDMRIALFTNSITPNFDTDTAYGSAPYNANEVSGTGYTAGGELLATTEITVSSGTLIFDAANVSWATSTITNARGGLIYADAVANQAVALIDFTQDYSTVAGLFEIQWDATGIFRIDLTP